MSDHQDGDRDLSPIKNENKANREDNEDDDLPTTTRHFPQTLINLTKLESFISTFGARKKIEKDSPRGLSEKSSENSVIEEQKTESEANEEIDPKGITQTKIFDEENVNKVLNIERIHQEAQLLARDEPSQQPVFIHLIGRGPQFLMGYNSTPDRPNKKEINSPSPLNFYDPSPQKKFNYANPFDVENNPTYAQSAILEDNEELEIQKRDSIIKDTSNFDKNKLIKIRRRNSSADFYSSEKKTQQAVIPSFRGRTLSNSSFEQIELSHRMTARSGSHSSLVSKKLIEQDVEENIQEDVYKPISALSTNVILICYE